MTDTKDELGDRWRSGVVLKRDVFSTIERGHFRTERGEVDAVQRRLGEVPWWSRLLANELFRRERRALAIADPLGVAPPLLYAGRDVLVRGWIDGVPLHIAKPHGDAGYFRAAKVALFKLHRAGINQNDLAKEQNWLYAQGRAYVTDFQLAACFRRRGWLFRIARYEDLRHLLKHKRRYAPEALTGAERRVLARKSFITRAWMATGKKVYYAITRGLNFTDREGRGVRFVRDAPRSRRGCARIRRCATSPSCPIRTAAPAPGFTPLSKAAPSDRELARFSRRHKTRAPANRRRAAAQCARRSAQRNSRARRNEPARPDRAVDQDRCRARHRRPHRFRPPQSARPLCVLALTVPEITELRRHQLVVLDRLGDKPARHGELAQAVDGLRRDAAS